MSAINYLSKLDEILLEEGLTDFSWIENLTDYQSYAVFESKEACSFFDSVPRDLLLEFFLYGVIKVMDGAKDYVVSNHSCNGFFVAIHFDSLILNPKVVIDPKAGGSFINDFRLQRDGFEIISDVDEFLKEVGRYDILAGAFVRGELHQIWLGYADNKNIKGISKYLS
ncbi:hypothetical protein [Rheinheimera sp. WS51]|uniref:hypothetical protein n=1 Tax=Rheinheimera sp. WS51 TaxID=3425886 RepID=UPI003D8D982F